MLASAGNGLIGAIALSLVATLFGCKSANVGTATPPAAAASAPQVARLAPQSENALVGRDANAVIALYGKPAFVRKEADSELWRYDGTACTAFFFLYRAANGLRLRHVETLPRGSRTAADEICLSGIKARAGTAS